MKFVIDSNIIFSSLISGKTFYMEFLNTHEAYAPDFLLEEISEYERLIIEKTPLQDDFYDYAREIFKYLKIIPKIAIRPKIWEKALDLCGDIDEKDTPFLALSLEMKIPLITRDKKLYRGLISKCFDHIILFEDFLEQLQGNRGEVD
jgi:predicted nucleic acid-binding protein